MKPAQEDNADTALESHLAEQQAFEQTSANDNSTVSPIGQLVGATEGRPSAQEPYFNPPAVSNGVSNDFRVNATEPSAATAVRSQTMAVTTERSHGTKIDVTRDPRPYNRYNGNGFLRLPYPLTPAPTGYHYGYALIPNGAPVKTQHDIAPNDNSDSTPVPASQRQTPSIFVARYPDGASRAPVPMQTIGQQAEAMLLIKRATFGSDIPLETLVSSREPAPDMRTLYQSFSRDQLDQVDAWTRLQKFHGDGQTRSLISDLHSDPTGNKNDVASHKFMLVAHYYPSHGVAQNPLFHSSESGRLGTCTIKLRAVRVTALYEKSFDGQCMFTFHGDFEKAVPEDERRHYIEIIDVKRAEGFQQLDRHDVLFAEDVGSFPGKTVYICINSQNFPYHASMVPERAN